MATKTTKADREAKIQYLKALREMLTRRARAHLLQFTLYTMPQFNPADFHARYYEVLTRFARGEVRKLMVFVPPQHGKEISDDEIVITPTGARRHGDLAVGDYVFGRDGLPVRVEWVSEKTQSQYVVTFSDGSRIECHGRHEWVVYDRSYKAERRLETQYIASQKLDTGKSGKRGHRYRFQIDPNVCVQFSEQSVGVDPYTLGAWLGDGDTSSGLLHIGGGDVAIVERSPYEFREHKGSTTQRFYSSDLHTDLKAEGLLGHKHIPSRYIYNSVEVRKELVAGLIDTDGYVYHKNGRVTISNTNKEIIDSLALLLRSLGQSVSICSFLPEESSSGIKGRRVCYQLCFTPTIDFPTTLERKRIIRTGTNKRRAIVSIDRVDGLGFGNCIQVEGGVYLVGDTLIPTHNSEGSTRRLPAFLLGQNPDTRVAIVSYNASKARKFNREIQRIIDTPEYASLFPETRLNASNVTTVSGSWLRNADECEIVGHLGGFKTVGVGGALTGEPVDVLIMDDIYKDAKTAWSPTVREAVSDWYDTVAETRLHNGSRQLIVFTRWHEDDLAGKLLREQGIYHPTDNPKGWQVVSYPAIKVGAPTEDDPRGEGEPLWAERHSLDKLEDVRRRSPHTFESLYQQDPKPQEGLLYAQGFRSYETIPRGAYHLRRAYVDTADTGADYLCAILYEETDTAVYVLDVLYTQKPMEETEPRLAELLTKWEIKECFIESNNGGRGFARNVEAQLRRGGNHKTRTIPFTQTANKATRILVHSASVQNLIHMPVGWERNFHEFATALSGYIKAGKNPHDDAPDALTGVIERLRGSDRARLGGLFG